MSVEQTRKIEIYTNQITNTIKRLTTFLETDDQDYINTYVLKVLETSFNRGYLPQPDIKLLAEILNTLVEYNREPKSETVRKRRDWFYTLDDLIHFKVDYCIICKNKLHSQGKFPKGYPDIWKLCCNHRDALYAGYGVDGHKSEVHQRNFEKDRKKYEKFFSLNV